MSCAYQQGHIVKDLLTTRRDDYKKMFNDAHHEVRENLAAISMKRLQIGSLIRAIGEINAALGEAGAKDQAELEAQAIRFKEAEAGIVC